MAYWVIKNEYEAAFQEIHILLSIVYNKCFFTNMFAIKKTFALPRLQNQYSMKYLL